MSRVADPQAKAAVLRAAESVFAARGVADAKVEDIADAAGLSTSAFFVHFESKDAALKAIVENWLERCASLFAGPREYPDAADDPDSLLDFVIERDVRLYEFFWDSRVTMGILRACQNEYDYLFDSFRGELQGRNREWLDQWRRDGLVRPEADLELAATLMSGAHEELSHKMLRQARRPDVERWVEFAQETFVRAFGTQDLISAFERRNRRAITGVHERARGLVDERYRRTAR